MSYQAYAKQNLDLSEDLFKFATQKTTVSKNAASRARNSASIAFGGDDGRITFESLGRAKWSDLTNMRPCGITTRTVIFDWLKSNKIPLEGMPTKRPRRNKKRRRVSLPLRRVHDGSEMLTLRKRVAALESNHRWNILTWMVACAAVLVWRVWG